MVELVIPSGVENGAAGEAATWTRRPQAEPTGSRRIKSRGKTQGTNAGSFDSASLRSGWQRHGVNTLSIASKPVKHNES
jgi:hypothetical protein